MNILLPLMLTLCAAFKTDGWTKVGKASPLARVELQFAFHIDARAERELERTLYAVSDPQSPRYGAHLTRDDVTALLAAPASAVAAVGAYVHKYARSASKPALLHYGTVLSVEMSVADAERLLSADYARYCESSRCLLRSLAYEVPAVLRKYVAFVGGVRHFPSASTGRVSVLKQQKKPKNETLQFGWTPRALRDLFKTTGATPQSGSGNRQAVASFLGQYFSEADLQEFFTLFYQEGVGRMPSKIIPKRQGWLPGVEANLDVQYVMATSDLVDTWVYSNAGLHEGQEPFLKWLGEVANESDATVPKTISVSYGDMENSIDASYRTHVNAQFMAAGARGISIMFASGDSGASCTSKGTFDPGFPSDSPWVTVVGGVEGDDSGDDLVGDYISGGGFSNDFPRPAYQQKAVDAYLAAADKAGVLPPANMFNRTGRAMPDVAAPSEMFWVVSYLVPSPVAGTSCASPSFTTVISLLNEVRMASGKKPLGFLNPFLYGSSDGFLSVENGCNAGCPQAHMGMGFCAVKGVKWSPVSGLGVPQFDKLSALIK